MLKAGQVFLLLKQFLPTGRTRVEAGFLVEDTFVIGLYDVFEIIYVLYCISVLRYISHFALYFSRSQKFSPFTSLVCDLKKSNEVRGALALVELSELRFIVFTLPYGLSLCCVSILSLKR